MSRTIVPIAIAVALMFLLVPFALQRTELPGADGAVSGFLGTPAYAQVVRGSDRPALPPLKLLAVAKVHPISLEYARRVRDSSSRVVSDTRIRFDVAADSVANIAAWRISSQYMEPAANGQQSTVETVYVARGDLRLVRRAIHVSPYSRFQRINVWQRFIGDSITGRMNTEGPSIGAGRTFARRLPSAFAPYLTEATAPAILMAVPLARGWRASASLLEWAVRDDDVFVPMEMRVEGKETITVPAGRFECWRLTLRFAGKQLDYWVRTSDGIGVRLFDPHDSVNHTREVLLMRER